MAREVTAQGERAELRQAAKDAGRKFVNLVNQRVKGSEKYWSRPDSAEAILQVRAALLCNDNRLSRHIFSRPGR